jgi:molybdopterin-guanine dinucleotide biosynthesis protein A
MHIGGVILCGGKSSRMGYPKAMLPFVQRVVRLLGEVVSPIVVVASPGQELPPLPQEIIVAHDEQEGRGPLEGLLAGLSPLVGRVDAAYATGCDVPLLEPEFVRQMIARLGDNAIAVPVDETFSHPLAAVYRTSVVPHIADLLAHDQLRPVFLSERVRTVRVPTEELRAVDPELRTLTNLNHPVDYFSAVATAGFSVSPELIELGSLSKLL